MKLTKHQAELLASLKIAAEHHRTREAIYKSEWLGYLPYGQYHWVEVGGEEIKPGNQETLYDDMVLLEKTGAIKAIKTVRPNNEDKHIYYKLCKE